MNKVKKKLQIIFKNLSDDFMRTQMKASTENTNSTLGNSKPDPLHWRENNPDWYPQEVKGNKSKGLNSFIEKVLFESNESMIKHKSKFVSNLIPKQNCIRITHKEQKHCNYAIR